MLELVDGLQCAGGHVRAEVHCGMRRQIRWFMLGCIYHVMHVWSSYAALMHAGGWLGDERIGEEVNWTIGSVPRY